MVVLEIAGAVALVLAIVMIVVVVDRKKFNGVSMFQRRAIEKRGLAANATILDRIEVSSSVTGGSGRAATRQVITANHAGTT